MHTEGHGARRGRVEDALAKFSKDSVKDEGEVEYFEPIVVGKNVVEPLIKIEAYNNGMFTLSGIVGSVDVKEDSLQAIVDALQAAMDWSRDL